MSPERIWKDGCCDLGKFNFSFVFEAMSATRGQKSVLTFFRQTIELVFCLLAKIWMADSKENEAELQETDFEEWRAKRAQGNRELR